MRRDSTAPLAQPASRPRKLPLPTVHLPAIQPRPVYARDKHTLQAYAKVKDVYGLMRELTHTLLLNMPKDPVAFLHGMLGERMASNGGDPATGNPPEHKPAQVATDAAMLRVEVEYSGCEGVHRRNFSTLVASASPMARSRAQAQATGAISSLLWGASSPRAQACLLYTSPSPRD